jgi:hypothetical protein
VFSLVVLSHVVQTDLCLSFRSFVGSSYSSVLTDLISEAKLTREVIEDATASIESASHAAETKKNEAMQRSEMFESSLFDYTGSAPAPQPEVSAGPDGFDNEPSSSEPPLGTSDFGDVDTAPKSIPEPTSAYGGDLGYYNYGAAQQPQAQSDAPPTPQHPPQYLQQPPQAQPTPMNVQRPDVIQGHNRQTSGFDSGFVMGGSAAPLPETTSPDQASVKSAARTRSRSGDYGFDDEDAFNAVEEMKKTAERAAEAARDAQAAASRLAAEADELRSDADKAEANARSLRAAAEEQKKGRFGGGKKKNMLRDADRAAEDAAEIKKRFMAIQTQAHDAATLAAETRREADRLKTEAEKAEMELASAASLREHQAASQPAPAPAPMPRNDGGNNGYGLPPKQDYGGYVGGGQMPPPDQAYGGYGNYGQQIVPSANGGGGYYSGGPPSMSYAPGVMGGGGDPYDLPSPATFQQQAPGAGGYNTPY